MQSYRLYGIVDITCGKVIIKENAMYDDMMIVMYLLSQFQRLCEGYMMWFGYHILWDTVRDMNMDMI